ncbi:MAG TPA: DNA glycosylase [Puia sp.]|nr:DNA glycosylase [Puia sp.]
MGTPEKLYIPLPANFNFSECSWYLDMGYDDCGQQVRNDSVLKALRLGGKELLVEVVEGKEYLEVTVLQGQKDEGTKKLLSGYIREWMDMDRDLDPFYALLRRDRRLAYMSEEYKGLRLMGIVDLFEALAWSIIGQQINLTFAFMLKRRLVEKYGGSIIHNGETFHLFPSYEALAAASVEDLRLMQLSRSKAAYLINLADVFAKGELSREKLMALPDRESRLQALMKIKGIGVWTANYCLMKSLRDPSGIPHGDTGLLTALAKHKIIKERKELSKIERFFSKYRGWESYLVFYFWRSLSVKPDVAPGQSLQRTAAVG